MTTPLLSLLVVTRADPETHIYTRGLERLARGFGAEYVLAVDGDADPPCDSDVLVRVGGGPRTYLGAVLNDAIPACNGQYILRLDDDESVSIALLRWLADWMAGRVEHVQQYIFPRLNLWGDERHALAGFHYYPDWQGRLSTPDLARRSRIHEPWSGDARPVDAAILHHYFLLHDADALAERARIAEAIEPGAGANTDPGKWPPVCEAGDGKGHAR